MDARGRRIGGNTNVVNIYDVAKQSGVSIATVSRVLNGSAKVRPVTAARVHAAMNELSFSPNIFAQSLQTNSMRVLTVLTVDISDVYFAVAVSYTHLTLPTKA